MKKSYRELMLEYVKTDHWAKLSQAVLDKYFGQCAICASDHKVGVSHLVYRNLHDCTENDLLPLCLHHTMTLRKVLKEHALEQAILDLPPQDRIAPLKELLDRFSEHYRAQYRVAVRNVQLNHLVLDPTPKKRRWVSYDPNTYRK